MKEVSSIKTGMLNVIDKAVKHEIKKTDKTKSYCMAFFHQPVRPERIKK